MIKINLLPFRLARKKENVRRQVSIFMLLLAFAAGLLYYGNSFWSDRINDLEREVASLDQALKVAMTAAQEVDRIKKELEDLAQKMKVIGDLKANRREQVELLEAMTTLVIEKRMWFTSFSVNGPTISIKGIALDNTTVADFMRKLEQSKFFSTVILGNLTKETVSKTMNLKKFEITCNKALPESPVNPKAKVS
ncbi:MAG: PilN domain-containing protein [Desulfobacterales bacterium]|jgi:type IV pilus assembly protein PilN|nr:PilN domain-containing protein [Desulfobacterales bacterium]